MRESAKGGVKALGQRTSDKVQRRSGVWDEYISVRMNAKDFYCHAHIILLSPHLTKMIDLHGG